jgi:hypothetical protein
MQKIACSFLIMQIILKQCAFQIKIEQMFVYSGMLHISNSIVPWMKYVS